MTLNLTELESTRVIAALAGADFWEKNPSEGRQITGHWAAQKGLPGDGTGL